MCLSFCLNKEVIRIFLVAAHTVESDQLETQPLRDLSSPVAETPMDTVPILKIFKHIVGKVMEKSVKEESGCGSLVFFYSFFEMVLFLHFFFV